MENTKIEWADNTFNPWWGCFKVSAGCGECYAAALSKRYGNDLWGPNAPRRVMSDRYWGQPIKWNQEAQESGVRRRVFCASMADVFEDYSGDFPDTKDGAHGGVRCMVDAQGYRLCTRGGKIAQQWPDEAGWRPYTMHDVRDRLFELIEATPFLDWLLLTKRPENIMRFIPESWDDGCPMNVWMGTSVENQDAADKRIPELLKVPAVVRFLSCEPFLGLVDIWPYFDREAMYQSGVVEGLGHTIDWVIAGGESGHGARPMHPDWARSLRDQCEAAGVAFLFKQWGEHCPERIAALQTYAELMNGKEWATGERDHVFADGLRSIKLGKKAAGRLLDGRTHDEFPKVAITA